MKTSNYLIALAALTSFTFVSCSDNDFLGNDNGPGTAQGNGEISFATGGSMKTTRAGEYKELTGKDAATVLDNQFFVYGWKSDALGTGSYTNEETVFPYYLLTFEEGSANSTESNTHSWEYVGNTSVPTEAHKAVPGVYQTIKYWDYAKAQYDFIAWDIKPGSTATYALKEDGATPYKPKWLEFKAETADEAANIYFADKVTVKRSESTTATADVGQPNKYGGYVTFKFRNLTSKVRMALYETIPGYSVTDVVFYSAAATPGDAKTYLYSATENIPTSGATINVKFSDGTGEVAAKIPENQAVASLAGITNESNISFGTLTPDKPREYQEYYYEAGTTEGNKERDPEDADYTLYRNKWLGRVSNDPSFATGMWDGVDIDASKEEGKLRNHYTYVFPKAASELCLKVNYRLKSLDGSSDDIIVTGANAIIPASFCEWKSNFAYTYLFKISDNTNGSTATPGTDPAGLYPITFDACVVDMVDGNAQETITELANASVTTYQFGTVVTDNDEYIKKDAPNAATTTPAYIYVTASLMSGTDPASGLATLATAAGTDTYKAELFLVNNLGEEKTTEEAVANYKNNKIILTNISSCLNFANNIPAEQTMDKVAKKFDGTKNKIAYFAPETGYTYAVRFTDNAGKQVYKVIKVEGAAPTRAYTLTTTAGTAAENAILDKAVLLTENYKDANTVASPAPTAKEYKVLGAGPLLSATNFTFVDDSGETGDPGVAAVEGAYDAVANVAASTATAIQVTFNSGKTPTATDGTNKLATNAYEFAGTGYLDVYPDGESVNKIDLNLGTSKASSITSATGFAIEGLSGASGVNVGTVSAGNVAITVADDAKGGTLHSLTYSNQNDLQTADQVLAAKTIFVDKWSLGVDKKYVNYNTTDAFKTTATLTLSLTNSSGTTVAKNANNASKFTPASTVTKDGETVGQYKVTPTSTASFKVGYTNANPIEITTTNYSWVLKTEDESSTQAIGTKVPAGTYHLLVKDGSVPADVSTLSIDNGTITRTGTKGTYKVVVTGTAGATISLNYKGINNYIVTAYKE